jgi:excisionase family DNA binding protein
MSGNHASTSGFRQPHDLDPKSKTGPAGVIAMRTRDEIGRTVDEGETRYVGVEWITGHRRQNNQMVPLFQLPHACLVDAGNRGVMVNFSQVAAAIDYLHSTSVGYAKQFGSPQTIMTRDQFSSSPFGQTLTNGRYHMEQLLLSPQEAAQSLGISRSRLYELIRKQELVSILIGRSRRIPVVALREYVQKMTDNAWVA